MFKNCLYISFLTFLIHGTFLSYSRMHRSTKSEVKLHHKFKSPVTRQFKSPLSRSNAAYPKESYAELQSQVAAMKKILQETDAEIHKLKTAGYEESELLTHIDKMHEYNEIKDVGQMVLGRLAIIQGVQSKDLYEKYDLKLND